MIFLWIAASVADIAGGNPNGNKNLLARVVSTFFNNDKPDVINDTRKSKNPLSWPVTFIVVRFNTIPLCPKNLITFIIHFISLLARVIAESSLNLKSF